MDEKQLQELYKKYGNKLGKVSFDDFSKLLSVPKNRELFFNEVKPIEYKTLQEFDSIFSTKSNVVQPTSQPVTQPVDLGAYQERELKKQSTQKTETKKKETVRTPVEMYPDDPIAQANSTIPLFFNTSIPQKATTEAAPNMVIPKDALIEKQNKERMGGGSADWDKIDAFKRNVEREVVKNGDNAYAELQKLTTEDIEQMSDEEVSGIIRPDNKTDQAHLKYYLKARKIKSALASSSSFDEAAVNYTNSIDPETKARIDKLMSYGGGVGKNVPRIIRGEMLFSFLNDEDVQYELGKNSETAKKLREETNNFVKNYPEFATIILGAKLSRKREEAGQNNGVVNVVEKGETDELVDEMFRNGELSSDEVRLYKTNVRPKLGLVNFGRALFGKEIIKTPGVYENFASGLTKGLMAQGQGLAEIIGLRDKYKSDVDQLYTDLERQYENVPYNFSGVHNITQAGGDITGQAIAIGLGGRAFKGLNPSGAMGIRISGGLQAYGNYISQARIEFPDDPIKQQSYALILSGVEMATEGIFNDAKALRGLTGEIKNDVAKLVNKYSSKEITAEAARMEVESLVKNTLPKYIKKFGKEVFKGNTENSAEEVAASIGQNVVTDLFKGRSIDQEKLVQDAWDTAVTSWFGSTILSGLAARAKIRDYGVESRAIYEIAKNPEPYKTALIKNSFKDAQLTDEAQEKLENIDFAAKVLKDIEGKGLTEKQEERYLIQSLNAEVLRKKAANTSDEIVQQEIKSEINETVKEREAILQEKEDVEEMVEEDLTNLFDDGSEVSNEYFDTEAPKSVQEQFDELTDLQDPYDVALQYFGGGGKINTSVIESLFGGKDDRIRQSTSTEGERRSRIGLMSKTGKGLDELAHDLWENQPEPLKEKYTTQDFRNGIEEALLSHISPSGMKKALVEKYTIKDVRSQFTEEDWAEIEGNLIQKINNQVNSIPDAQSEEIINFLRGYQDQYGEINWSKLEADTNGFQPEFLELSEEAQNFLYAEVERQGEPDNTNGQDTVSQEKIIEAQKRYDKAQAELKTAEDEISQKQATQGDIFSGAQTEMFGVNREDAKAILDPLREEVRLAKQELDKINFEAELDQPELFKPEQNDKETQATNAERAGGEPGTGANTGASGGTQRQNGDARGSGGTGEYTQSDLERELGDILKLGTTVGGEVTLETLGITPTTPFAEIINKLSTYEGEFKPLMQLVKNLGGFENIKVREATQEELAREGGFEAAYIRINDNPNASEENKGTLLINPASKKQYYALVHEIMHWVTLDAQSIDRVANQDKLTKLNDIYNILYKNLGGFQGTMESYGLKDFKEFLAELLINPNFREYVQGVIIENKAQFDANVEWASGSTSFIETIRDFFIDLINRILGKQGDVEFNKPLVESAVKIATDVFFDGRQVVYEQMTKYPNVKLKDSGGEIISALPSEDKMAKVVEVVKKALANNLSTDTIASSLINKGLSFTEVQDIIVQAKSQSFEKEQGKKSVLNRAYEGQTDEDIKVAIAKNDLNYDVENQVDAERRAKDFIASVGIANAIKAVGNGEIRGAAAAQIYADAINYYNDLAIANDSLEDSQRAAELQMEMIRKFDETSRDAGRFISMLQRIYETSDFAFNAELQINNYKARAGEISPEVEQKFRDLEAQYNELKEKLADAEKRAKEAEEQQAILDIQDSLSREGKNPKQTAKELANRIRKAKLSRPGMFSAATPASLAWDGAVEVVAKAVEAGGALTDAIQRGVRYIKQTSWYRGLNQDDQNKAIKEFENALAEDPIPQPFISDSGRIVVPDRFIRDAVKNGVKTIDELVTKVKEVIPEASERQIRDAITKYGKTVNLSKDEIDAQIRKIKRIGKIVSQLEDVSEGKRPLRSGLQRDKPDVEERELMKQLAKEMEDLPLDEETEARELKTALDAIKTRLSNQIEDIQREIETGQRQAKTTGVPYDQEAKDLAAERDRLKKVRDELIKDDPLELQAKKIDRTIKALDRAIEKTKQQLDTGDIDIKTPGKVSTPEIEARRNELAEIKKQLQEARNEAGVTDKRKIETMKNRVLAQIKDLQDRIDRKDFAKKKAAPPIVDSELTRLKAEKERIREEFAKEQYRAELKARSKGQKFLDGLAEIFNLPRVFRATGELSFILIQGGVYTISHPIDAAKAFKQMIKNFFSENQANKFEAMMKAQEWYQRAKDSKLALTEPDQKLNTREEMYISGWANHIWDILFYPMKFVSKGWYEKVKSLNPLKAFERANVGYMNTLRIMRYLEAEKKLAAEGKNFYDNQDDYKNAANVINTFTGRGSLGKAEMLAKPLSVLFFSPRNWSSQIKISTPYFLWWMYQRRTPGQAISVAQKMAISDWMKYTTFTLGTLMWAAQALNDDDDEETGVSFDPTSSDFLKIKSGNTRIDPFGGKLQFSVLIARLMSNEYTSAGGKTTKLGQGAFAPTEWDLLLRSVANKFSPSARLVYERFNLKMKDGKYYKPFDDEEYSFTQSVIDNMYPIYWDTIDEIKKDNPEVVANFLVVMAALGANVNVYESKKKKGKTVDDLINKR